ncbi:MAG TPA: ABC transporter substrate-binding protein, partial [Mesorhizobium sp.]|nr:ABC transporter substrate-binding protein [Mesorhizobium sp.]
RQGWGWHDMSSWQAFFDSILELGQITNAVKAEDVCTNDLIAGANNFDKAKVKADADGYKLTEAFAGINADDIKAHMFDQAIKG